ncbi:hypothetical protein SRHO_G00266170 [Serrasalmus rhombeus]
MANRSAGGRVVPENEWEKKRVQCTGSEGQRPLPAAASVRHFGPASPCRLGTVSNGRTSTAGRRDRRRRMSDPGKSSASASSAATTTATPAPGSDTYKGWLFKWTNYLKGYQRRWFVLSNGLLSYYRTQAEMAHTCRGTINLATAHIDTEDACNIVLSSGGRTYHLKASTEVERQKWVTALELAKAKAIRMMNDQSGSVQSSPPPPSVLPGKRCSVHACCLVCYTSPLKVWRK